MESGTKKGVKECVGKQGCVGSGLGGNGGREGRGDGEKTKGSEAGELE